MHANTPRKEVKEILEWSHGLRSQDTLGDLGNEPKSARVQAGHIKRIVPAPGVGASDAVSQAGPARSLSLPVGAFVAPQAIVATDAGPSVGKHDKPMRFLQLRKCEELLEVDCPSYRYPTDAVRKTKMAIVEIKTNSRCGRADLAYMTQRA
ncbi:uncharacterized protein BP01DRAFT_382187 [Aspergillus saccharolyticus JOP 1030-1]|uniref:Uncharacterized protein n=1 Tax=Aspergillus saccharolyticus JOP 1030-1 TaxID=1450539 RepID=A0A318ZHZ1_9EURO|nr:hypothetical protein BP01DRAFT_382187 [Aspergillus saccharolyticus JOP 1030-1]PYH46004.1 hypothetical protein BP01DRAFT_382187 [Aspergillus saccharolyticus JOP 1030-1]